MITLRYMRETRFFTVMMAFLLAATASCGQQTLSRVHARTLIETNGVLQRLTTNVRLTAERQAGIDLDIWDSEGDLTPDGRKSFASLFPYRSAVLNGPTKLTVDITGIAQEGPRAEVQFQWSLSGIDPSIRQLIESAGNGVAVARKYDDGWRIDEIDPHQYPISVTLSEPDQRAVASRYTQVVMARRERVERAEAQYRDCTSTEAGQPLGIAARYQPSGWPDVPFENLLLAKGGVVVKNADLRQAAIRMRALIQRPQDSIQTVTVRYLDIRSVDEPAPRMYGPERGSFALLISAPSSLLLVFPDRQMADSVRSAVLSGLDRWKSTCAPAAAEMDYINRQRHTWKYVD